MSPVRTFGFQWHLTDRCNLRCHHCYQDRFDDSAEPPLSELIRMADRVLPAVGPRPTQVNLTGGEPLLLPWLGEVVDHLRGYPHIEEINVITNGTVLDEGLLERLGGVARLRAFKVSLESADLAINDRVRGRGNLARVEGGLEQLRRTGKDLVLMVTLGRHNAGSIEATARWAEERGFDGVIFERFVPLGRGLRMAGAVLGPAEWAEAVMAIVRAAGLDATLEELLPYRAFWLSFGPGVAEPLAGALCNLGDESMALMPEGTVLPCRRLPLPAGNVLEEPIEVILDRLASWGSGAVAHRLHGGLCGLCGVEGCSGCRAMAFALAGDPLEDDPQCSLVADRAPPEG